MEERGFVTQRVAELLRSKGFDIPTLYYYRYIGNGKQYKLTDAMAAHDWNSSDSLGTWQYSAPTVQVAIDWVETKGYWIVYRPLNYNYGVDTYIYTANDDNEWYAVENFVTQDKYEGLNKALEYCLENLIR